LSSNPARADPPRGPGPERPYGQAAERPYGRRPERPARPALVLGDWHAWWA